MKSITIEVECKNENSTDYKKPLTYEEIRDLIRQHCRLGNAQFGWRVKDDKQLAMIKNTVGMYNVTLIFADEIECAIKVWMISKQPKHHCPVCRSDDNIDHVHSQSAKECKQCGVLFVPQK